MMAKRTTAVSLKRSCAQLMAVKNLFKRVFTCQRPQLYTNQVPRRSMHKPLNYRRDGQTDRQTDRQTDVISALYSRLASVPALSCRLGRVSYNRAFGALMCCIQSDLRCSLTRVTKSVAVNRKKNCTSWIRTRDKKVYELIKNMR